MKVREIALRVCDSLADAEGPSVSVESQADREQPLSVVLDRLDDPGIQDFVGRAARLRAEADRLVTAGAGVIAKRSERALGMSGLAARQGHRSAPDLLQAITGSSRGEAFRQVRMGEAMGEAEAARSLAHVTAGTAETETAETETAETEAAAGDSSSPLLAPVAVPWFEPVTRAVTEGSMTAEGAAALLRGFGEPSEHCTPEMLRSAVTDALAEVAELKSVESTVGLGGAVAVNVDVLTKLGRQARDRIDPVGVAERFERRYQERSWRLGRSQSGARTAWVVFDDESAAWLDAMVASGMRPRRGGPRFIDPAEARAGQALVNDPRSNDQLVFDLVMDTLRAGSVADPTIAFGNRQPGVRVIVTREQLECTDVNGNASGIGYFEESGEAVPGSVVERLVCEVGERRITVDACGTPWDVGREQRLFTAKQRVALAYRDGGCVMPGCDMPPSYTEAHHSDEWAADHGRTDTADGALLCRFHHMRLHQQHARVRREGDTYWLIPPPGTIQRPVRLRSKAAWRRTRAG
jgi:hypothetical protein